jgi:hypothetical protein
LFSGTSTLSPAQLTPARHSHNITAHHLIPNPLLNA